MQGGRKCYYCVSSLEVADSLPRIALPHPYQPSVRWSDETYAAGERPKDDPMISNTIVYRRVVLRTESPFVDAALLLIPVQV